MFIMGHFTQLTTPFLDIYTRDYEGLQPQPYPVFSSNVQEIRATCPQSTIDSKTK